MVQVRDYTALLSGSSIAGKISTGAFASFSFPTAVPDYLRSSYSTEALATFRAFNDAEKAATRQALAAFAAVSGLTLLEVAADQGDLKFANYDMKLMSPGAAGFAYYPDNGFGGDVSSDVFIGDGYGTNQHILLHEIGHALGLKHTFEGSVTLATDLDNFSNTVMSYTSGGNPGDVLGPLDLDALRYIYGDTSAKGRQIASWNWDEASMTLTQTGSEQADTINGIGGSDVIYGLGGNDTIQARGGNNRVFGGDGNDVISGGSGGNNYFDGGAGDDRLTGGAGDDTLIGGAGNDTIMGGGFTGSGGFDRIDGGEGDDTITLYDVTRGFSVAGGAGNDRLFLYPTLTAGSIFSIPALLAGGSTLTGIETVSIQIGVAVTVVGSDGRDTIYLSDGADDVSGQAGDDYVSAGGGNDLVRGGDGADNLYGGAGNDTLSGEVGNDTLNGDIGDDLLWGGDGADSLYGGSGNDTLRGEAGNDYLDGGVGLDLLYGGAGDDTLRVTLSGTSTSYVLDGGEGNDNATAVTDDLSRTITNITLGLVGIERLNVTAGNGADRIDITGIASVTADGGAGDDTISIGDAAGSIYGGVGADFLTAGSGFTFLYGGSGADRFIFLNAAASNSRSQDQIEDFQTGVDLIDITGLSPTNVRVQSSSSGSWLYADSTGGSFQLFVRATVSMADIVTTGLVLAGTAGADRLVGTAGADRLSGGAGNDVLVGAAGNDMLDGGADIDRAAYAGLFRNYAPSMVNGITTLRGGVEGTDTLTSVEYITFVDGALISDPDSVGAQVVRLYDTVLDRGPDAVGLDYWVDQIQDRGATLATVANSFVASAEFQAATGGLSNARFVDYVYSQALGRTPDASGKAYWTGRLDAGLSRGELLIGFSESAEHRAATAALVGQGYFDTDDTYQAIALLYDSFTGRRPDATGLTYWSEQVKSGARSIGQVAAEFAASAEFAGATRGMTNGQLVDFMYQNTLDRGPDAGGRAYWTGQLDRGLSKGDLLLAFSQSDEHASLMAPHIIGGIDIV